MSEPWRDNDYAYRKEITIQDVNVDGDLSDFPLLVRWVDDTDINTGKCQADLDDIRFYDSSGNLLKHETVWYEIDGTDSSADVFVKKPTVYASPSGSDNKIWMYYGYGSATNGEDAENVWDDDYIWVFHLTEASGTVYDSTGNSNDAAFVDGGDSDNEQGYSTDPRIGDRCIFVDQNGQVDIPDSASLDGPATSNELTMSCWFRFWVVSQGSDKWLISRYNSSTTGADWIMAAVCSSTDEFGFYIRGNGWETSGQDVTQGNDNKAGGTWYYGSVTYDESNVRHYVNGVLEDTDAATTNLVASSKDMSIGRSDQGSGGFRGPIDEARFSKVARSADWQKFEYANMAEADNELTWGSEETPSPPASGAFPFYLYYQGGLAV